MNVTTDETTNVITAELTEPGAFHCFQQGLQDRRQWQRHPETRELHDIVVNNSKHAQVVVKYNDTYLHLNR